jgi:hypothetical protein
MWLLVQCLEFFDGVSLSLICRAEDCVRAEGAYFVPANSVVRALKSSCANNSLRGHLQTYIHRKGGRDIVGIAIRHDSVFEPWWGWDFPYSSRQYSMSSQPTIQRLPVVFLRVKRPGRGVNHPHIEGRDYRKGRTIDQLLPLYAFLAAYKVNFTFYLFVYRNWLNRWTSRARGVISDLTFLKYLVSKIIRVELLSLFFTCKKNRPGALGCQARWQWLPETFCRW